eukprot:2670490-Amphidinium_carterae.2
MQVVHYKHGLMTTTAGHHNDFERPCRQVSTEQDHAAQMANPPSAKACRREACDRKTEKHCSKFPLDAGTLSSGMISVISALFSELQSESRPKSELDQHEITNTGSLTSATQSVSVGGAICWRLSQHVWLDSVTHAFDLDHCYVGCVINSNSDAIHASEILPGHWSKRTRFQSVRSDESITPLFIIRTEANFKSRVKDKAWQSQYCQRVISDYEEVFEVTTLPTETIPAPILMCYFAHKSGCKVRSTVSTRTVGMAESINAMMSNMMLDLVLQRPSSYLTRWEEQENESSSGVNSDQSLLWMEAVR